MRKMTTFSFYGKQFDVKFLESNKIKDGVVCDVYEFVGDPTKDLALITIESGCCTPKQKVLQGDKTIEGYISGSGRLTVTNDNGDEHIYEFPENDKKQFTVNKNDIMQWQADTKMTIFELCYPPYANGRFENLNEQELEHN